MGKKTIKEAVVDQKVIAGVNTFRPMKLCLSPRLIRSEPQNKLPWQKVKKC